MIDNDSALRKMLAPFVDAGVAFVWLRPRSKAPAAKAWTEAPPARTIEDLFSAHRPGQNIGVRMGEPSCLDGLYLHALDLDIRDPAEESAVWDEALRLVPNARELPRVKSGSGGASRHLYFLADRPLSSAKLWNSGRKFTGADGKSHWSAEIELIGTGKQVVFPGSIHPDTGRPYEWEVPFDPTLLGLGLGPEVPADTIASWSRESISSTQDEGDDLLGIVAQEPKEFTDEQIKQILDALPEEWREDRNLWRDVGFALHHQYQGSEDGLRLWHEFSAPSDKYEPEVLDDQWEKFLTRTKTRPLTFATLYAHARENLLDKASEDFPLGEAEAEPEDEDSGAGPKWLRRMNRLHAVVSLSGKTRILNEHPDGTVDFSTESDLHAFYANRRVPSGDTSVPMSKLWMQHPDRRTYRGVCFDPQGAREGLYNFWQGFAFEPNPNGSCALILEHLRENICDGDEASYAYLEKYLAHMVQRPWEKPGVAIVLRGRKGTGKDTVGDYVGAIFPHHHTKVSNQEHFVGRFNQHLARTLLLHVEEGYWAGNKAAESALKHLITSERQLIEPKGVDAASIDSYLRLLITSNEEWVVPATWDERRYFVLDVSERRARDTAYFGRLRAEMANGGPAALLAHLQAIDLTGFDVRQPPATKGLLIQKLVGLRNVEGFVHDLLETGELPTESGLFADEDDAGWETRGLVVRKDVLFAAYAEWMKAHRFHGDVVDVRQFGKRFKALIPSSRTFRANDGRKRPWCWRIPPLPVARQEFGQFFGGGEITWGDEEGDLEVEDLLG